MTPQNPIMPEFIATFLDRLGATASLGQGVRDDLVAIAQAAAQSGQFNPPRSRSNAYAGCSRYGGSFKRLKRSPISIALSRCRYVLLGVRGALAATEFAVSAAFPQGLPSEFRREQMDIAKGWILTPCTSHGSLACLDYSCYLAPGGLDRQPEGLIEATAREWRLTKGQSHACSAVGDMWSACITCFWCFSEAGAATRRRQAEEGTPVGFSHADLEEGIQQTASLAIRSHDLTRPILWRLIRPGPTVSFAESILDSVFDFAVRCRSLGSFDGSIQRR